MNPRTKRLRRQRRESRGRVRLIQERWLAEDRYKERASRLVAVTLHQRSIVAGGPMTHVLKVDRPTFNVRVSVQGDRDVLVEMAIQTEPDVRTRQDLFRTPVPAAYAQAEIALLDAQHAVTVRLSKAMDTPSAPLANIVLTGTPLPTVVQSRRREKRLQRWWQMQWEKARGMIYKVDAAREALNGYRPPLPSLPPDMSV